MDKLQQFVDALRERRVKKGVDYCYTFKYGQVRVLCHDVFADAVREVARECGIDLVSIQTYE